MAPKVKPAPDLFLDTPLGQGSRGSGRVSSPTRRSPHTTVPSPLQASTTPKSPKSPKGPKGLRSCRGFRLQRLANASVWRGLLFKLHDRPTTNNPFFIQSVLYHLITNPSHLPRHLCTPCRSVSASLPGWPMANVLGSNYGGAH
jgi:hypothetical protein